MDPRRGRPSGRAPPTPGPADPDRSTTLPEHPAAMHRHLDASTHDGRSVSSLFPSAEAAT